MGKEFQRTLLWVILFTALFMLWDNYQVSQGKPSFFQEEMTQQEQQVDAAQPANIETKSQVTGLSSEQATEDRLVTVTTDLVKVTFDLRGAQVVRNELIKIPNQADWTETGLAGLILGKEEKTPEELGNVVLLNQSKEHTYVAQIGFEGEDLPSLSDDFTLKSQKLDMGTDNELSVVFEAVKNGVTVTRTYTFKRGEYAMNVRTDVKNDSAKEISPKLFMQITRDDKKPVGDNIMYSTYTGMAFYSNEEEFQKVDFDEIVDGSAEFVRNSNDGWVAMVQHHFVSAWLPKDGQRRENYVAGNNGLYTAGLRTNLNALAPGQALSEEARLYSGPQTQQRLEQLAPGLDSVVDYGWLTFLAKPIYWLLSALYARVGNWGWAIVILTCIVKLILYPISAAGYRSMARMKEVTPRIQALQAKYKDDKVRLNQAMVELYQKEKINPIGGCLPIMLQIPVFLALYWVLQGTVELRGSSWILWVQDLGMPDPWFILPLLMAATMFLQIFLNPKPADPAQARVMYLMPVIFSVMFFVFRSGLVLYWLTNNVLSILQQWWINKTIAAESRTHRAS